jgi:hypothetical protein
MNESEKPKAIPVEPVILERLQLLWNSSESGELGFSPKIEPGFELDYYAGSALLSLRLRIGILRHYLAPTIKPEELSRHFAASLEWVEKDLDIIGETLRLAMKLIPAE